MKKHSRTLNLTMTIITSIILMTFVLTACSQKKEKKNDEGKASDSEITLQDSQDLYSMQFLNMINVLSEIRAGRSEQLAASIENSIPAYLKQIAGFNEASLKTVSFYTADLFYQKEDKTPPAEFEHYFTMAAVNAKQVLSKDCYDLLSICTAPGCTPLPTSLRPVNIDSPNPAGWHYIVDSNCGFSWPKIWNLGCGPPINGPACQ